MWLMVLGGSLRTCSGQGLQVKVLLLLLLLLQEEYDFTPPVYAAVILGPVRYV